MPGGLLGGLSLFGSSWSWSSVGNLASTQFCLLIFILNSKFISDLTWFLGKISYFYPVTAGYNFYNTMHSNISILEGALLLPCYCIAGPAFTWLSSQQSSGRSSKRKLWMEFFCYHWVFLCQTVPAARINKVHCCEFSTWKSSSGTNVQNKSSALLLLLYCHQQKPWLVHIPTLALCSV